MLRLIALLTVLLCFVPGPPPADAQQRFTQNPISLQRAAGADGDGSSITTKGYLSVALQVTGTFTATVNFEGTADASTWVALKCVNVATDSRTTTLTAAGMVQCNVQGMSSLRARVSGWSDGAVTVTGYLMDVVLGSTSGGGGSGSTIADGDDATLGAIADAASTAGGTGTISAKLRNATALLDTGNTTLSTINGKLPSAGSLADDTANPTTTGVAAYNMCFDGSTWDRCVKADAGAGNVSSATQRVVLANNSIPCTSFIAVSQADDATVITGTASQYIYICSIVLVGAASEVINIIEGTGTVCATGTTVMAGSSTQANGMSFAANGGFSAVSAFPFMRTSTLADNLCITQSGTSRVSGWISYTKAP